MSIFTYLNESLVASSNIRLRSNGDQGYEGLSGSADGTGSQGGIVFDDSAGSLSVTGWQIVKVTEPDCTSAPVLFYGTVADHTEKRGPYRQGASRQIDTTINDSNVFLSLRILTAADGAGRPAETDTARLAWLLGSDALEGLVYDLGFVTGAGRTFEATSYHGQYPADVLSDLCGPRGQIFFTYWSQSAQKVGLFFDSPAATTYTCTLSISNVQSDITLGSDGEPTGTVMPPYYDGELAQDPSDVYSRVRYKYKGASLYRSNAATAATFFPPPLDHRDIAIENERVGLRSTAITFADRFLEYASTERSVLRFTVRLKSTQVGLIQAGMRINCRFAHLTGFTTGAYTRIERLTTVPVDGDPTHYDVTVECSSHGMPVGGGLGPGTGGGSTAPFPPVGQTPTHFYEGSVTSSTENDAVASSPNIGGTITGWTPDGTTSSTNLETPTFNDGVTYNYTVNWILNALDVPIGTRQFGIGISGGVWSSFHVVDASSTTSYSGSFTQVGSYQGCFTAIQPGFAHGVRPYTVLWTIDPVGWDTGETPEDPKPGAHIEDEVPSPAPGGGNTTFTTLYAFAEESLLVFVDGVDETSAVTSMSGADRTFTLGFDPRSYEVVTVHYLTA